MVIKYYNDSNLAYCTRKRYNSFNFEPFYTEVQRSVLLGDGGTTTLKTSKKNICNYVTIDDTRWFVTSYFYLNGGQVQLNLKRDVIGEFGINNTFGKINRGITDNFLKYRKELSLNQILKKRVYLQPNTYTYGNAIVDTHENENWGIVYLTKPSGINPETGEPYSDNINVNIPAFTPSFIEADIDTLPQERTRYFINDVSGTFQFRNLMYLSYSDTEKISSVTIFGYANHFIYDKKQDKFIPSITATGLFSSYLYTKDELDISGRTELKTNLSAYDDDSIKQKFINEFARYFANMVYNRRIISSQSLIIDINFDYNSKFEEYENVVIKQGEELFSYNVNKQNMEFTASDEGVYLYNGWTNSINIYDDTGYVLQKKVDYTVNGTISLDLYQQTINYITKTYTKSFLTEEQKGNIDIALQDENIIDEPYYALIFPLYDCNITINNKKYTIKKNNAFTIFNSIIEALSGDNGYLVDAQIFPYCPNLANVSVEFNQYPIFSVFGNTFERVSSVQLLPLKDVKKEYIETEYSIIAPDQSDKFTFSFYDYINNFEDGVNEKLNYVTMSILLKIALKPFNIIASAVIQPTLNSLKGITYDSDMRGCNPISTGFECSIATNQFQQYVRNNSNYQQFFNLQKEQLKVQHRVELVNDLVGTVVNTVSATSMGAIAGASMADVGLLNISGSKAAGAGVGAAVAGGTVGAAMAIQSGTNAILRGYETEWQQKEFDLNIQTIRNLPNEVNRISSFNEILLRDFWFVIETYSCSNEEKQIVDRFIEKYSYSIGVYDDIIQYVKNGSFIKAELISSNLNPVLHQIMAVDIGGGVYYYE